MAATIYVFVAFVVLDLMLCLQTSGLQIQCPSSCFCLGNNVDCSKQGLISIPKDLPIWTTRLELQHNGISSISKDDFKGLKNLTHVDLSNNDIRVLNDSVFQYLTSLDTLKINHNKIIDVPKLTGLANLRLFELNHNSIQILAQEFLAHMPHLRVLELNHNALTDIIPGAFPANNSLQKLVMNNNNLESFEQGCLDNLTSLETLKINKNKITQISKNLLDKLTSLVTLEMTKNRLVHIDGLTFQKLENLQVLKLRKNSISVIQDGAFYGLENLHTLQLEHNNLTRITQSWLYGLDRLKEINLPHNRISIIDPKAWEVCPQVHSIDLSNNKLVTIGQNAFSELRKLRKLILNNNMITNIQDGAFQHLYSLEELELNNNEISWTIEDKSGVFVGLDNLRVLKLENNKIKSIAGNAFDGLKKVKELYLNNNNITSMKDNALAGMAELQQLFMNSSSFLCDCNLAWLPGWLISKSFHMSVVAKCAHPPMLRGKSIFKVSSPQFMCHGDTLKPRITMNPKSRIALKGENITLNCQAVSTENLDAKFSWKKDNMLLIKPVVHDIKGKIVIGDGHTLYNYTSHLYLVNIQDAAMGNYQCIITNKFGSTYSKKANISIHAYPEFIKTPIDVKVKAGTTARFECSARGKPTPQIVWRKANGLGNFLAAIEKRFHVMPADDVFFLTNVKPADEGVYSCTATNSEGSISVNVSLSVQQPPFFTKPMVKQKIVNEGQTAVIECMADGRPKPKLTWKKNNNSLELTPRHFLAAGNQLLIIVQTQVSDMGKYTCEMINTLGSRNGNTELIIMRNSNTGGEGKKPGSRNRQNDSVDESTTTGIIIIAVVCCVVGTSLVWVIIIYQTRKRHELYSSTPTDETALPGEVLGPGYMGHDKDGTYSQPIAMTPSTYQQYQEYQMKESGYESSSGRIRAARAAAIFPSDVEDENGRSAQGPTGDHSPDNSVSYPDSETDSLKSSQSTSSTHTSGQQTLRTFHPTIGEIQPPPPLPPSKRSQSRCSEDTRCENCEKSRSDTSDQYRCQSLNRHSSRNIGYSSGLPYAGVHHGSLPQPPGAHNTDMQVSECVCDSPKEQLACAACHNRISPVYNSPVKIPSNSCSYHTNPHSNSHSANNGPCYLNTQEIHICTNPHCVSSDSNKAQGNRGLHRFRSAENCVTNDNSISRDRGHHSLNRHWSTEKIPPVIPSKQHKHYYIHANKCSLQQNGGPHKYPRPQDV